MDPLQRLLELATHQGILSPLPSAVARWWISMYADDAAVFINPIKEDLEATKRILQAFGNFLGLHINLQKSSIHPIRCEEVDLDHIMSSFAGTRGAFPCRYLGLQLHVRKLRKIHVAYRAHWPKVAWVEREMAKYSWSPHSSLLGPLIHADLPPHGVPPCGLG